MSFSIISSASFWIPRAVSPFAASRMYFLSASFSPVWPRPVLRSLNGSNLMEPFVLVGIFGGVIVVVVVVVVVSGDGNGGDF